MVRSLTCIKFEANVKQCFLHDEHKFMINDKEHLSGKNGLYF